ncbi:MAG: ADP-ribosylglycohydrolase family protein [Gemmataceae bacterium]|nr:ADP-ribosylglycohydrolase family protein [Gemmataceae bacterium]
MTLMVHDRADKLAGVILGTAVGDALGLPYENLSRRRLGKWLGDRPLEHRFVFGRGMVSDDTEHTCMVGQALLAFPATADRFACVLAWRLRFWLLCLPAGIGRATLRSTIKLWLGIPPSGSGVWSAGNGPAMRAALLGVCLGQDLERLRAYVRVSTRITHTDPRAERGASLGPQGFDGRSALAAIRSQLADADDELNNLLDQLDQHLKRNSPPAVFAEALGLRNGVSGYIYHTVPAALYCWLRSPGDFRGAVEDVIRLGGDMDTTGAIVAGLSGATVGARSIPPSWLDGLTEWPQTVRWMRSLAYQLATRFAEENSDTVVKALPVCWPGQVPRNLFFLVLVLGHACRRLLPPY